MEKWSRVCVCALALLWLGGCSLKITFGNPNETAASGDAAASYEPNTPVYLASYPGVEFYEWYDPGCGYFVYVRYYNGWWWTPQGVHIHHGRHLPQHTPPAHAFAGRHPQHTPAPAHQAPPAAHRTADAARPAAQRCHGGMRTTIE